MTDTRKIARESKYRRLGRCVEWTGNKTPKGYGRIYVTRRKFVMAHRAIYEGCFRKIPTGFVIDHLCRNTSCINPKHMEVVTPKKNVLRGIGLTAQNAVKTHCLRGHKLSGKNLKEYSLGIGQRQCKLCNNIRQKAIRALQSKGE